MAGAAGLEPVTSGLTVRSGESDVRVYEYAGYGVTAAPGGRFPGSR